MTTNTMNNNVNLSNHRHQQQQQQQHYAERQHQHQKRPQVSSSSSTSMPLPQSSELNDTVERILLNIESRQDMLGVGKISISELEQLSLLASNSHSIRNNNNGSGSGSGSGSIIHNGDGRFTKTGWALVNVDSLCELGNLLEEHIHNAARVDYIKYAREKFDDAQEKGDNATSSKESLDEWLDMTPRKNSSSLQLATILRQGLQAATLLISIMITPFIDRRIISEDAINSSISLMRHHIHRNLIPSLSSTGHTAAYAPTSCKNAATDNDTKQLKPKKRKRKSSDVTDNSTATSPKVKKSYQQSLSRFLKKAYKPLISLTIGYLVLLMEKIDLLIQSVQVDDQPLLSICAAVLSTLTIDPTINDNSQTHVIQTSGISLVSTVFRQYPRHRIVVLEDLFPLYLKLPTSKRSMRTYPVRYMTFYGKNQSAVSIGRKSSSSNSAAMSPLNQSSSGSDQGLIQVMSALILFLIQSCITVPIQKNISQKNDGEQENENATLSSFSSTGLEQCEIICKQFTNFLIQRCAKKGDDGGASEFRPILYNLIDDLLDVQLLPDFPAAEMLLMEICRRLTSVLLANSSIIKDKDRGMKKNNTNVESTYLTTAMDTIGTICSDIASKLVAAKENPLEFTKAVPTADLCQNVDPFSDEKEINGCFCGREKSHVFSLDCDRCHRWFHGNCLRIAKDYTPTHWHCDECKMILLATSQVGLQFDEEKDLGKEERAHIMRIVLLNFISQQLGKTQSMPLKDARQFHVAKFIKEADKTKKDEEEGSDLPLVSCAQYLDMWTLPTDSYGYGKINPLSSSMSHEYLSEAGNTKVMIALNSSKSELVANFPRILGVLVALMGDGDVTSLRKLAVKAISQVVRADSSLMSKGMIRDAVSKRFQDEAISVREAVVTLVGVYVLQVPNLAKLFHNALLERLNDNGISVRKRVIKIFRDLIITNPSYEGRTSVLTKLLQQAANRKEDGGVRDLIHETFQMLWFTVRNDDAKYGVLASSSIEQNNESWVCLQNGPYDAAKQMLEIIIVSPTSQEYLAVLVKEMLYGSSEGDKKKSDSKKNLIMIQTHCSSIVSYLFEELITFEEKRASLDSQDSAGPRLVALLSTVRVYAESSPTLLLKHIDTLLPYLKADNAVSRESEAAIVFNMCKILSQLSHNLSETEIQRLGNSDLPNDLMKITYVFDSKPTSAAVEVIAKFAIHNTDGPFMTTLMKLAKIFYKLLVTLKDKATDFTKMKAQQKSNIQRAMSVIGSICQNHDNQENTASEDIEDKLVHVDPSQLTWSNLPYASYTILEEYLDKEDMTTKCNALRAMAGVFFTHPRIMLILEEQGILKELMSETSHPNLQLETLKCFQEILVCEEQRVESGEARRQMQSKESITSSKQVSGDQDGDASLIGSCCAEQLPRLFQLTSSCNAEIREYATRLIETLSRQGLLNPMEAIPHLIALQGDLKQPQIRFLSLRLLKVMIEKRPGMVRQGLADGIKQSFFFQCKVYPEEVTAIISRTGLDDKPFSESIFKDIFEDVIGSSRTYSKKTIKSLLSMFSNHTRLRKKKEAKTMDENKIPFLSYITEILAYLPLNHLGDVLFVIHSISETVALEGNETMRKITSFLRSSGLSDVDPDPSFVDVLEKAATKKNPCRSKALAAINNRGFDMKTFSKLCTEACSLSLLVRLYFYLRKAFKGVTDKRLVEYDPGEKERINERGISKALNMSPFDSQIPCLFLQNGSLDKDNLIRQYAIFRDLMRNYDSSFNVQSEGDKSSNEDTDGKTIVRKRKFSDSD